MKKLKLKFDGMEGMLNKQQMKSIKGGYSSSNGGYEGYSSTSTYGRCTVTVHCNEGSTISCSGSGGHCHYGIDHYIFRIHASVQCDDDDAIFC